MSNRSSGPHYSAQDPRGGEIILKSRRHRAIFAGGLATTVVVAIILGALP